MTSSLFSGCTICLIPDRIGPARLQILRKNLEKHSAVLMSSLESAGDSIVVVVDDEIGDGRLKELAKQIDTSKSSIVTTNWLTESLKQKRKLDLAAFDVTPSTTSKSPPAAVIDLDVEPIEKKPRRYVCEFSSKADQKPSSSAPPSTSHPEDQGQTVKSDPADQGERKPSPTSADGIRAQNSLITSQLKILSAGSRSTNDKWRALAYDKAIKQIERIDFAIERREQVLALPGVGAKIADKICEIMSTGKLRKADAMGSDERMQTLQLFNDIWGVGPMKALEWYNLGYRTLDSVRTSAKLTSQQQIGLNRFSDILQRMPYAEATTIASIVISAARSINPRLLCTTCGSYRRGKSNCGDVDILITHPDGVSHANVLAKLVQKLDDDGFLTDHLIHCSADGNQKKYMGVCKLKGDGQIHRRVDIITVPYKEYAPSLIYFTGSAHFTRSIYAKAKAKGWRLNQHGLRGGVMRAAGEKLNEGYEIETPTEESVFEALGLKYLTPEERDHV